VVARLDFRPGDDANAFVGGVVVEASGLFHVTMDLLRFDLYSFAAHSVFIVGSCTCLAISVDQSMIRRLSELVLNICPNRLFRLSVCTIPNLVMLPTQM
jgi:hypothetical protein